ncbi:MAG: sugar transferase, partial [Proteobacteria bacterium]|nr:sugar transferase [Pseudomonadota bacterium]
MYDARSIELSRTVFLLDILMSIGMFLLSFWARDLLTSEGNVDFVSHLFLLPLLLVLVITFLSHFGAYNLPRHTTITWYAWAVFRGLSLAIGVLLTLLFFFEIKYVSRAVILAFAVVEFVSLVAVRAAIKIYFNRAVASGQYSLKLLIIGTGDRAKELVQGLKKQSDWGLE